MKFEKSFLFAVLSFSLVVGDVGASVAEGSSFANGNLHCSVAEHVALQNGKTGIKIDDVWSGTRVSFDAVKEDSQIYFGYYDKERWLSVARLNQTTGEVCHTRLNSEFAGWDSHNIVIMGMDPSGNIHVAGNMHAVPLVYGATVGRDLSTLSLRPMIGRDEKLVTYPAFLNRPDGKLLFLYRDGSSGHGGWLVNLFDEGRWHRLSETPIFADRWQGKTTSAYPSTFHYSHDGYVHLAVVWRHNPDVRSNYAIGYVRTADFVHWEDHEGRPIKTPVDPGSIDPIEETGEGRGLLNSARVTVSPDGRPIVAYTRYGPDGRNVIVLATPEGSGWRRRIVATAEQQTALVGVGSVSVSPLFSDPVYDRHGNGKINLSFPPEKPRTVYFDTKTLDPVAPVPMPDEEKRLASRALPKGAVEETKNLVERRTIWIDVRTPTPIDTDPSHGSVVYFSQGLHRDEKRACTPKEPTACNPPPSPMVFVPR